MNALPLPCHLSGIARHFRLRAMTSSGAERHTAPGQLALGHDAIDRACAVVALPNGMAQHHDQRSSQMLPVGQLDGIAHRRRQMGWNAQPPPRHPPSISTKSLVRWWNITEPPNTSLLLDSRSSPVRLLVAFLNLIVFFFTHKTPPRNKNAPIAWTSRLRALLSASPGTGAGITSVRGDVSEPKLRLSWPELGRMFVRPVSWAKTAVEAVAEAEACPSLRRRDPTPGTAQRLGRLLACRGHPAQVLHCTSRFLLASSDGSLALVWREGKSRSARVSALGSPKAARLGGGSPRKERCRRPWRPLFSKSLKCCRCVGLSWALSKGDCPGKTWSGARRASAVRSLGCLEPS